MKNLVRGIHGPRMRRESLHRGNIVCLFQGICKVQVGFDVLETSSEREDHAVLDHPDCILLPLTSALLEVIVAVFERKAEAGVHERLS